VNVLALDTSTDRLSLAVSRGPARHARDIGVGQRHAGTVFAEMPALLNAAGLELREIDAFAFGAGPGAFPGLRIACGVVQGLAEARGVPVIGVSCLEAVAAASGAERVVACIDARMGEVYHAVYTRDVDGVLMEAIPPSVAAPDAVPLPGGGAWVGCGSGFRVHRDALLRRHALLIFDVYPDFLPTASAILEIALPRLAAGAGVDASRAVPVYLRDRVALTVAERAERRA
jgi:tRNA threonylcarbamoyladenosine biosynthesis protein TsaB